MQLLVKWLFNGRGWLVLAVILWDLSAPELQTPVMPALLTLLLH